MTWLVCPKCKNGRTQQIGNLIVCPEGHIFKLKEVVKNAMQKKKRMELQQVKQKMDEKA